MRIYLVSKNKHKLQEVKDVMSEHGIEIEQIADEKIEPKELDLREVVELNARHFFEKYNKPVVIDDTGVFFHAYPGFPGNHPKLIFNLLGYKGLLKLLENESRKAQFKTFVGYCGGKEVKVFEGSLECTADDNVHDIDKDVLPYERILLVQGRPLSSFSRAEKNLISHRAKAFRALAEWLRQNS